MAIPGAPGGAVVEALSNGERIQLRRVGEEVGIRLPEGEGFGLRTLPMATPHPAGFGWVGNPQLVLRVPSAEAIDLAELAQPLRHHAAVPGGTNVNVVEILEPGLARIRSWERGVEGETPCCGTGCAVAAAWLAHTEGITTWRLRTASGDLVTVSLEPLSEGRWRELWLTGPVRLEGEIATD